MIRRTFSTMFRWLGHGSAFGNYYGGVHRNNCTGCPDCRCVEGPSHEEARRDFRAMVQTKIGGSWYSP